MEWLLRKPNCEFGKIFAASTISKIRFSSSFSNILESIGRKLIGLYEVRQSGVFLGFIIRINIERGHVFLGISAQRQRYDIIIAVLYG